MARWRARGHTCETGLVESADGAQDLFHARTETTYPRRTIFLAKREREASASIVVRNRVISVGRRTRNAFFACGMASQGAGRSRKTGMKTKTKRTTCKRDYDEME